MDRHTNLVSYHVVRFVAKVTETDLPRLFPLRPRLGFMFFLMVVEKGDDHGNAAGE
jgi:hypothetical protein